MQLKVERLDPKPLWTVRSYASGLGSSRSTFQCLCFSCEKHDYCMDTYRYSVNKSQDLGGGV